MWRDKYFIVSLILSLMQLCILIYSLIWFNWVNILFCFINTVITGYTFLKITYDIHKEKWEKL